MASFHNFAFKIEASWGNGVAKPILEWKKDAMQKRIILNVDNL